MKKGVADFYRFYQVGRASNERYLEALAAAPDHRQGVIARNGCADHDATADDNTHDSTRSITKT